MRNNLQLILYQEKNIGSYPSKDTGVQVLQIFCLDYLLDHLRQIIANPSFHYHMYVCQTVLMMEAIFIILEVCWIIYLFQIP